MTGRDPAGWLVEFGCAGLDAARRELLVDQIWLTDPVAIEEQSDVIVAGYGGADAARAAVRAVDAPGEVRAVVDDSYLDEWKRHLAPQRIGAIAVRAPWHQPVPGAGHDIVIEAGRSFGSGAHPSTRVMLELLPRVALGGARVLDFGCGSGVLAIAAVRLGAHSVVAVDIDGAARAATADNAARNRVAASIMVGAAPAVDLRVDVVLANVLLPVHRDVAAAWRAWGPRDLLVAGALADQRDALVECYAPAAVVDSAMIDGWIGLWLRPAGGMRRGSRSFSLRRRRRRFGPSSSVGRATAL